MKNKSAKDLAFDRERVKYKRQIVELMAKLKQKDDEIYSLNARCDQLQDWVDRLLEYTELSKEELVELIKKEKESAEVAKDLKAMLGVMRGFGSYF